MLKTLRRWKWWKECESPRRAGPIVGAPACPRERSIDPDLAQVTCQRKGARSVPPRFAVWRVEVMQALADPELGRFGQAALEPVAGFVNLGAFGAGRRFFRRSRGSVSRFSTGSRPPAALAPKFSAPAASSRRRWRPEGVHDSIEGGQTRRPTGRRIWQVCRCRGRVMSAGRAARAAASDASGPPPQEFQGSDPSRSAAAANGPAVRDLSCFGRRHSGSGQRARDYRR